MSRTFTILCPGGSLKEYVDEMVRTKDSRAEAIIRAEFKRAFG